MNKVDEYSSVFITAVDMDRNKITNAQMQSVWIGMT
jgi:hypothetical protein